MDTKQCKPWSMGPHTLEIPMELFALNRKRMAEKLDPGTIAVLEGGKAISLYNTSVTYIFRQDAFFMWACGVREPGCVLTVETGSGYAELYVPKTDALWEGGLATLEEFKETYCVQNVYYIDDFGKVLKKKNPKKLLIHTSPNADGIVDKQRNLFKGIEEFDADFETLDSIISELRIYKTEMEKDVMRYACKVSSEAHKQVMLMVKPGLFEYQCESEFLQNCYQKGGCRHVAYTCICGSGKNSGILHYGHAGAPNNKMIEDGDMCLHDMGGNYGGWASDVTVSFPANGKFTENQKLIYNAVLAAKDAALKELKPGVGNMYNVCGRVILEHLKDGGLLNGDVDDMMKAGINRVFLPHGISHFIGLDTHDVGGSHSRDSVYGESVPEVTSLRRPLEANMAITVEPGCYFNDELLDKALENPVQAKYFNQEYLKEFRGTGGVRIEDCVLVNESGVENMTFVPRTTEEIEAWMKNGANFK